jgi:hypothetical protein
MKKMEDLNLTPEEIKMLVDGAQTFLAPTPDDSDNDRLTPTEKAES